jgi:hypothetical protein
LMMQIMERSSLPILSDGLREKDINNPEGYYELEAVGSVALNTSNIEIFQLDFDLSDINSKKLSLLNALYIK